MTPADLIRDGEYRAYLGVQKRTPLNLGWRPTSRIPAHREYYDGGAGITCQLGGPHLVQVLAVGEVSPPVNSDRPAMPFGRSAANEVDQGSATASTDAKDWPSLAVFRPRTVRPSCCDVPRGRSTRYHRHQPCRYGWRRSPPW